MISLVLEAQRKVRDLLATQLDIFDGGSRDAERAFEVPVRVELSQQPHRVLKRRTGEITLADLHLTVAVKVSQSRLEFDRGRPFDLALAVENYFTRQRRVVTRTGKGTRVHDLIAREQRSDDILPNGMLMKVFLEPWVAPVPLGAATRTKTVMFALPDWQVAN